MSRRLLIVNADDFGLAGAANDGIIAAHCAGSVTSTSFMVNMPASKDAAALAADHPELGVGLHFNLTLGAPVVSPDKAGSLATEKGSFGTRNRLVKLALVRRLSRAAIAAELDAQYQRALDLGVSPTHVDSHQHVHAIPIVFDVVAEFCRNHRLPVRMPWVPRQERAQGGWRRNLRRLMLRRFMERNRWRWDGILEWNDAITSIFDLPGLPESLDGNVYRQLLDSVAGDVVELMVHPVTDAEAVSDLVGIGKIGEREFRFLTGSSLSDLADESGFFVGRWSEVADCRARSAGD